MPGRTVHIELGDITAADVIDALRGRPPSTEVEKRRREALAELLAEALFTNLLRKDKP